MDSPFPTGPTLPWLLPITGLTATLEDAQAALLERWEKWLEWTKLSEAGERPSRSDGESANRGRPPCRSGARGLQRSLGPRLCYVCGWAVPSSMR